MRRVVSPRVALILCACVLTGTGMAQAQNHAQRKVISRIEPTYPELAKRMQVSGVVKLEVVIRTNGSVKSIAALGGNPVLIQSATTAVGKWKFEASPKESTAVIELTFALR
ncbi:MAG: energy transducer TonB [Candidatus Sulfotelmatobacter sp.]